MNPIGCLQSLRLGMAAAAANSKIFLSIKKQKRQIARHCCCSICGKKLKFARTSENPLIFWQCMIVNADP